ncbi:MAG: SCO family protein [Candidatus Devosia phytovorans]|uniref:SCO family protein n=1 Tax=Candidatus Devosia phytovorans TaxID=3121372 RepID=A0AAJ5VTF3_9HYPH|nr:SCO family protein [Devosia sp.]WEK03600.1 MAG: SCO family protein [Devosia sp.]
MANLARIRMILWGLVGVAAVGAIGLYAYSATSRTAEAAGLGHGDYQLATVTGEPFNRQSFDGNPSLLFFGFTHCPEVCPTSLAEIASWYEALGDEASDLKAYFVTVDPERDTPAVLEDYVSWTGHVTGLVGTPEETEKATRAWAVYAAKVSLDDGSYTMDHTASVFLLDKEGEFSGTIAYREDSATALGKLRNLLSKS